MAASAGLVVLITGGASGIGAGTARALKARGSIPVLIDCDAGQLRDTAAGLGATSFCADVLDYAACRAAVAQTLALHGRINVVWANAGIVSFGPLHLTDLTGWKRGLEVNVFGTLNIVRAALPAVMARRGYVLATASVFSFAHPPAVLSYAASKAAIEAMCNCWHIRSWHRAARAPHLYTRLGAPSLRAVRSVAHAAGRASPAQSRPRDGKTL